MAIAVSRTREPWWRRSMGPVMAQRGRHHRGAPSQERPYDEYEAFEPYEPPYDPPSSRTGIHRAEGGLLRNLYDQHAEPLLMIILEMTEGDRRLAEEVVRETLLSAWRDVDSIDVAASSLRPWLVSLARRILRDMTGYDRGVERRLERDLDRDVEPDFDHDHDRGLERDLDRDFERGFERGFERAEVRSADRAPVRSPVRDRDPVLDIGDDVGQALQRMLVLDGLRALQRPDRQILIEAYFRGRGVRDVADELGLPPETVKWRLFFALRALQKILLGAGSDDA